MTRRAFALVATVAATGCGSLLAVHTDDEARPDAGAAQHEDGASPAGDAGGRDRDRDRDLCATGTHLFCDDFEDGADPRWAATGGAVGVEDGRLVAALPAGGYANAFFELETGSDKAIRVSFELRVAAMTWPSGAGGSSNFGVARFTFGAGGAVRTFNAYVGPAGGGASVQMTWQVPAFGGGAHVPFALDEWHHVVLEADVGPVTKGRLEIDGATVGTIDAGATDEAPARLQIGAFRSNDDTPPLRVEIDDVVVDEP